MSHNGRYVNLFVHAKQAYASYWLRSDDDADIFLNHQCFKAVEHFIEEDP